MSVLMLLIALGINLAVAQNITGNLEGRIINTQNCPILSVNVIVSSPSLQGLRGTLSDKNGKFHILALPAGLYTLKISHVSFHPVTLSPVRVYLGMTSTVGDVSLQEKVIELAGINISAQAPGVDPVSTTTGANIQMEEFKNLPIQRAYQEIAVLLPQVNASFLGDPMNIAGATGLENKYYVDGVDVTDPNFSNGGTRLPYNFIREVQLLSGGYNAEYRSSLGGILNVTTYSGGNEFHGQVFGFFANNRLTAEPKIEKLNAPKGAYHEYDIGMSVGGPIVKDKLWFFAAYNPNYYTENVHIPGFGFSPDERSSQIFATKLSWRASAKQNFFLTLFGDPGSEKAVSAGGWGSSPASSFLNIDPALTKIVDGGINVTLNGIHVFNDHLLLESSVSRVTTRYEQNARTSSGRSDLAYMDMTTGIVSGGAVGSTRYWNEKISMGVKGTWILPQHTVKAGLEYVNNRFDDDVNWYGMIKSGPDSYSSNQQIRKGVVTARGPSVFVQDSWQVFRALKINAGLRWDGQYLIASNGQLFQKLLDQYQPRLGMIWQPGGSEKSKIIASAGRFYQDVVTSTLSCFAFDTNLFILTNYDHDPRIDPAGGQINDFSSKIQPRLERLKGQHYDGFSLGYESQLFGYYVFGIHGVYRILRQGLDDGFSPELGTFYWGNPGRGLLDQLPKPEREYNALEVTIRNIDVSPFRFFMSYTLSKSYGNYPGLFGSDGGYIQPNFEPIFDLPELMINAKGLLPNDRPHVFKFFGSYRFPVGLNIGTFVLWQSGTPLNEFGGTLFNSPPWVSFIRQRGTAGRMPSIWDLNLRMSYDIDTSIAQHLKPRLIFDVFHIGSPRKPVNYDQIHYFNLDENGNQINENPNYGRANSFQPPMALRLGMEVDF
jgi:hypothetical protein